MRQPIALPDAEWRILTLLAEGLTNAEIAARNGTRPRTVETQVSRLLLRLGVSNRVQAAKWFWENKPEAVA
jgi:DNA-binding NarL/FixJ family response regulator